MKHVFEEPVIEIFELSDNDIVTSSGCTSTGTGNPYDIGDRDPL